MSRRREELAPGQPNTIVFEDYFSKSQGRTFRIDIQSPARLHELETIMRALAAGKSHRVTLSQLGDAHWVPPLADIVLQVGPSWATPRIRYEERGEKLACNWTNSIEGWQDSAEETAAMTAGGPRHQYFTDRHAPLGKADSATLELAYME